VLSDAKTAKILNALLLSSVAASRSSIAAKTHQGLQLVPIAEINYFQADDKYVTAYHTKGELLIEDSIASLEREFNQNFIRIHRKTLVAGAKIETLLKNEAGQYFIKLRGVKVELEVSRRQLPKVRKILKWI
jgi:two-component system response regulator AlgR